MHPNKNPSAWREYFDWMMQYAKKRVGPNDARAVANEALYDAYLSGRLPSSFEDESEIRRWLATLIFWRVRAHWSRERWAKNIDLCDLEEREDLHAGGDSEPSDIVLDRLEILQVLPTLCSEDQTLLLERYVGGFSAPELAAKYGLNERTTLHHECTK